MGHARRMLPTVALWSLVPVAAAVVAVAAEPGWAVRLLDRISLAARPATPPPPVRPEDGIWARRKREDPKYVAVLVSKAAGGFAVSLSAR